VRKKIEDTVRTFLGLEDWQPIPEIFRGLVDELVLVCEEKP